MASTSIFLDSNIILSAIFKRDGMCFHLLTQQEHHWQFSINAYVREEIVESLAEKFPRDPIPFQNFLILSYIVPLEVLEMPARSSVRHAESVINANDAPILASAVGGFQYLLSGDKHFFTKTVKVFAEKHNLQICTPRGFLDEWESNV